MTYTMRNSGRLMTDVKITVSLTHEQVYILKKKAKLEGISLDTYLGRFVDLDEMEDDLTVNKQTP